MATVAAIIKVLSPVQIAYAARQHLFITAVTPAYSYAKSVRVRRAPRPRRGARLARMPRPYWAPSLPMPYEKASEERCSVVDAAWTEIIMITEMIIIRLWATALALSITRLPTHRSVPQITEWLKLVDIYSEPDHGRVCSDIDRICPDEGRWVMRLARFAA